MYICVSNQIFEFPNFGTQGYDLNSIFVLATKRTNYINLVIFLYIYLDEVEMKELSKYKRGLDRS